jgi:hypothetical protein
MRARYESILVNQKTQFDFGVPFEALAAKKMEENRVGHFSGSDRNRSYLNGIRAS